MYEEFYPKYPSPGSEYGDRLIKGGYPLWHYEFSRRTLHDLQPVLALPASNDNIAELATYAQDIAPSHLQNLQQEPRVFQGELDRILDTSCREDLQYNLLELFARIDTGFPSYWKEIKDIKLAQALFQGNITESRFNAVVKTVNPKSPLYRMLIGSEKGKYFQRLNLVVLPDNIPQPKEIWKTLAQHGTLPKLFDNANALLTLDTQITPTLRTKLLGATGVETALKQGVNYELGKLTMKLLESVADTMFQQGRTWLNVDPILSYIHEQEAVAVSPTTAAETYQDEETIINRAIEDLLLHEKYTPQIQAAYHAVHSLRLLGLDDDTKIGKIVSASRYRQGKYTAFEEPYYTQLQQWGIDSEDSEAQELLLTALEARHQLEWHWTRNRVQELTLQSLNLS